jgi:hypothetical protein
MARSRCFSFRFDEKNGGDDKTRTRGLSRDRATTTYNLLDSNGTDSPFLISNEFFDVAYQAQIGPRFGENCCTLTILSDAERIRRLCSPDQSTRARLKEARFAASAIACQKQATSEIRDWA